jgi:hypothetical protein
VSITTELDLAAWGRFSAGNKDRCEVCGHKAVVSLTVTASTLGGTRSETSMLAKKTYRFCDAHGQQAMLRGTAGIENKRLEGNK